MRFFQNLVEGLGMGVVGDFLVTKNNQTKQPDETTRRNNHKKQPQKTTTRNNHKKQPQETTRQNNQTKQPDKMNKIILLYSYFI